MRYELIKNSNRGILVDPMPVLRDIKDTFKVSFLLPEDGAYIALFRDQEGTEYKTIIKNGVADIPTQILGKEQKVGLTVCKIDNDKITHAWECYNLQVSAFLHLRQTQWQITSGTGDKEVFARLNEIERIHAQAINDFNSLQSVLSDFRKTVESYIESTDKRLCCQSDTLLQLKNNDTIISSSHNNLTKVTNDLLKRLEALEKNYDPTLIS